MTPQPLSSPIEMPLEGMKTLSVEEATDHISRLKVELMLRENEPPGIVDARGDAVLLRRSLVKAGAAALGCKENEETIRETAEGELRGNIESCLKSFARMAEKEGMETTPSGDRPVEPPSKDDRGYKFADNGTHCNAWSIPSNRRLQTFCVILVNFFTGLPIFLALYILMYFIPILWPVLALYNVWMVWDIFHSGTPRRHTKRFRNSRFWKKFAEYFPIRLRVEDATKFTKFDEEQNAQNYLFTLHPHGVHSFGAFINFATNANGFDELFPELMVFVQTLGVQFFLPLWRELARVGGCGDASKKTLTTVLTGKPGDSALLVVGGAEESLDASPGTFDLILKKRKGFIRVALETGSSLVPCFSFGENDVYQNLCHDPATRGRLKWIQAKLGFAIPLFMGRGIFNYHFGFLPHRRQITTVVGSPIRVKKWEGPADPKDPAYRARVDALHEEYMEALQGLYDRNKNIHALSRCSNMRFKQ